MLAGSAHARKSGVILVIAGSFESVCLKRSSVKVDLCQRPLSFSNLKFISCLRWYRHSCFIILKRSSLCLYSLLLSIYRNSNNVYFPSQKQSPGPMTVLWWYPVVVVPCCGGTLLWWYPVVVVPCCSSTLLWWYPVVTVAALSSFFSSITAHFQ